METMLLKDQNTVPTPDVLQQEMGLVYPIYAELMLNTDNLGISSEWNYYNDGKAWLQKAIFKKKTVFWLSVWETCFKITFYFTEKNCNGILEMDIDENIKKEFVANKPIGKLLPLTRNIDNSAQLTDLLKIIEYKMKLK